MADQIASGVQWIVDDDTGALTHYRRKIGGNDVDYPAAAAHGSAADGYALLLGGEVRALSEVIPEVLCNPTATTTVLTGAGAYAGYRCTTAVGNITVYDNTAASGKVLVPTTALAVGAFPIYGAGHNGRVAVATGVTVVLSGAAVVYAGVE